MALTDYEGRYESLLAEATMLFAYGKKGGRDEILKFIFEGLSFSKKDIESCAIESSYKFNKYLQEEIVYAGLIDKCLETLEELFSLNVPVYLNSGTATQSLIESVRNFGIEDYFRSVLGSTENPRGGGSKVDNLKYTESQNPVGISNIIFVGDSESD